MKHVISTKLVTIQRSLYLPAWMQLAINGEKINAIKSLRDMAGLSIDGGYNMPLLAAKNTIENFIDHIREEEVKE